MIWSIRKSERLKARIAQNEKLMKELSSLADKVLKNHGLKFGGLSYVFEPRVFNIRPGDGPELITRSPEALVKAILEEMGAIGVVDQVGAGIIVPKCLPQCGPLDPFTLKILEKYRMTDEVFSDSNPLPPYGTSEHLITRIVSSKKLLSELSEIIFNTLKEHGITFKENEGCVFTPVVFETPVFAQIVGTARRLSDIKGFGPQVYASPQSNKWGAIKPRPFPGIIINPWGGRTPGVIIPPWWWIGIPAPEMLHALDVMRRM